MRFPAAKTIECAFAVALATFFAHSAIAQASPAAMSPAEIEAELGSGVNASRNAETGRIGFIGTDPGSSIEIPGSGARAAALGFIDSFAAEFGIDDAADELEVTAVNALDDGRTSVRLQQVQGGVPVIGGELIVNLEPDGDVLSASGELEPKPVASLDPKVAAAEADDLALATVAKSYDVSAGDLVASEPELSIYDSRILGGPGLEIPRLVWRIEVTEGTESTAIREFVLVDAELGVVALNFSQIADAKNRQVCDANLLNADVPCVLNDPDDRVEGGPPSGILDVNLAYNFSGGVYDFFLNNFGRDSIDGAGMNLVSTVRFRENPANPYKNAFWNGSQATYGEGVVTDDIAGHEMAHGVTEATSNLFYYYQSGAINESMSDVFGELFDLSFGAEPADRRWLVGEDSTLGNGVPFPGVIRDMEDPPAKGDPDRMSSPLYVSDANEVDAGGVHSNSGVNNKATFLLTDGGAFNGRTVAGLGAAKVLQLYYEVNSHLLGSASDYLDLANALGQACTNLTGQFGITAADCGQVENAILATEMRSNPPNAPTRTAGTCLTVGDVPNFTFNDNLENAASGNWAHAAVSGAADRWFYPSTFRYATSGIRQFRGEDFDALGDYAIGLTNSQTVPPGAFLRFNHAFGFEDEPDFSARYDGGVVEYSTDSGGTWNDAAPLFAFGGYNSTITTAGNPLGAGRAAFVGESNGYGASRLDLASLAGQPLRIRFRIGTDPTFGDYGWFIDDIQIYNCPAETAIDSGPAEGETIQVTDTSVGFSASDPAASFECSIDGATYAACSPPLVLSGLADGPHSIAVRSVDASGAIDPTPASRSFAVDTRCPRALVDLKAAKQKLKKAKKKLKKAKKSGDEDKIKRAKKKVKKAKKAVKRAQAYAVSVCPPAV